MGSQIIISDGSKNAFIVNESSNANYTKVNYWSIHLPNCSDKNQGDVKEVNSTENMTDKPQLKALRGFIIAIITKEARRIDLNYLSHSYQNITIELMKLFHQEGLSCYCYLFTVDNEPQLDDKEYIAITRHFLDMLLVIKQNIRLMYYSQDAIDELSDSNDEDVRLIISLIESYKKQHMLSRSSSSFSIEPKSKLSLNLAQIEYPVRDLPQEEDIHINPNTSNNQMVVDDDEQCKQEQAQGRPQMEFIEEDEPIEDLDELLFELPTQRRALEQESKPNDANKDISEIITGFLYLGNHKSSKDSASLKERGITHIINCAADTCENCYENEIKYLQFYLKDSVNENIECVFYYSFEFIQQCKEANGKVLIHCYQGISRSASVVIAYLIYFDNLTSEEAFNRVQSIRSIINPNISFILQLETFTKRIRFQRKDEKDVTLFSVGSIQRDMPLPLVCRLIYENISRKLQEIPLLTYQGVYLLTSPKGNYIIIGKDISPMNKVNYMRTVMDYFKLIVKYEHCSTCMPIVIEQQPDQDVLILLDMPFEFGVGSVGVNQYNIDLTNINIEKELEAKEKQKGLEELTVRRKGFYFYPKSEAYKVLSLDDLSNEEFIIACSEEKGFENMIHIWEGEEAKVTQQEASDYIAFVKNDFFNRTEGIVEIMEIPYEESEQFFNLL